ncbi:hypothetical protein QTO17_00575 [Vibrio owensii]
MQPVEVHHFQFDFELNSRGAQNASLKVTRISVGCHDFVVMHDEGSRGPSITDFVDHFIPDLAIKYGLNYETTSFYQHSGNVGAQDAKFHQLIFDSSKITRRSGLPCLYEVAWKPVLEEQRLWMAVQVFHASLQ